VTNGSGCRSGRPQTIRIPRIRIRNTGKNILADQSPPFSSLCPGHLENYCREEERAATAQYLSMLADLVMFRVRDVYKAETLEERPPWMAPRPLARLRYQLPTTAEKLAQVVRKQVSDKLEFLFLFLTSYGFAIQPYFQILFSMATFYSWNFFIFLKKGAHPL
jgi:hypothetical protein